VWLTPILTVPWLSTALSRATAPFLLVGGTAQSMWDATPAGGLSPFVLEIDGADHGLFVPGPLTNFDRGARPPGHRDGGLHGRHRMASLRFSTRRAAACAQVVEPECSSATLSTTKP
jgi:hypothetical protein